MAFKECDFLYKNNGYCAPPGTYLPADKMITSTPFLFGVALLTTALLSTCHACSPGYTANNGNCYKFITATLNWDNARKECQIEKGDLALIETTLEASNVKTLRTNAGDTSSYYWIGGRQQPHASGPFQWLNGNSINDLLWYSVTGQPDQVDGITTQCVDLGASTENLDMNDYPCTAGLSVMCEKKCPNGWYDNQFGTCYKFVSTTRSWSSARTKCQQMGGDLAILDTQAKAEEMALLRTNIGKQNTYYWVGAQQETDAKGAFKYVNGARFNHHLWASGEPNTVDFINQQCVDLGVGSQTNNLFDFPCTSALAYICEKNA